MCYGLARIGRQKALVNRKYGHDTQGVRVLHTTGHSPDSICLLDEKNGLLFGGDTINTRPIYAQLKDSDVAAFARSTARLVQLADSVRRVFVCHFMRLENEP